MQKDHSTIPVPSEGAKTALLPCPFCGGSAEHGQIPFEDEADGGAHFVACTNSACGASTNLRYSLMDDARPLLVEQWNRRTPDAALAASHAQLLAALQEAVEVIHSWHGSEVWDIYLAHSPEMKRINAAIAKATKGQA